MGVTIDQELAEISDLALRVKANYSAKLKAEKIAALNNIRDKIDLETRVKVKHYANTDAVIDAVLEVIDECRSESEK